MVCPPLQQMMNRPFWFAVLWTWDAPLYGDWIAIWTWGVDQKKMIKIGGKVEVVPPVYMAMAHGNFCWVTSVQLFDKSPCLLANRVEAMKTKGREMTWNSWNMRNLNKVEWERTIQIDNWQCQHDFGSWTFGSIVYVEHSNNVAHWTAWSHPHFTLKRKTQMQYIVAWTPLEILTFGGVYDQCHQQSLAVAPRKRASKAMMLMDFLSLGWV